MKAYPSISTQVDFSLPYWIFDKIDGSNLRAEFSSKRGFYKFGSRTQLLTPDQEALWPAAARIESLEAQVRPVIERLRAPRVVCFFEWAGPNSFAGSHTDPAQAMELFLLDVDVYQKGRLAPEQVLALANEAGIATPALLHKGRIDADFLDLVRKGLVDGMGQAIAQETVTSQQVEMGMAAIRFTLASTFAGAVALFLVGAFVAIALRKRMETAYRKYLSTIPVPDLARFARGLETDAESRGHAIATLTARQPGWSYQ